MHYVYKITNKIDGKIYIGQSENPIRRFAQHRSKYIPKTVSLINRAINKYGVDNFIMEVLEGSEDPVYISKREYQCMSEYDSVSPKGYNLKHEIHNKGVLHQDSKDRLSKVRQGKKINKPDMTSQYTGVTVSQYGEYVTSVRVNRKIVARRYDTEILAAQAYDKLVLYLFGDDAKINFEDKREEFLSSNLEEFYNEFLKTYYKSKYEYVSCNSKKTKWRVRLDILQIPEKLRIDFVESELEAAQLVDKFITFYGLNKKLNFPDFVYDISDFPKQIERWKERLKTTSSVKGINHMKNGRWRAYYYVGKIQKNIGYFKTEQEAIEAKNKWLTTQQTSAIL